MAQAVTLMTASRGCSILGSGTSSHRMSPLPCHANAITKMLRLLRPPLPTVSTINAGRGSGLAEFLLYHPEKPDRRRTIRRGEGENFRGRRRCYTCRAGG